jgi:hypothetical protein
MDEGIYFLNRTQKLHDLGLTLMKDELIDHFKIKSTILVDELLEYWNRSVCPDPIVIEKFITLMSKHDVNVALLSNIGIEHSKLIDDIFKNNGFYSDLKPVVKHFSCFVGARKPSALYYQSFMLQYPEFRGALYIDDLQDNLDASIKFGLKPYKFALSSFWAQGCDAPSDKINEFTNVLQNIEEIILQN